MEEDNEAVYVPVPKIFHQDSEGRPFQECSLCEKSLEHRDYVIEKHFKRNKEFDTKETLLEHAMCMDCVEDSKVMISKESRKSIQEFIEEKARQNAMYKATRMFSASQVELAKPSFWLKECMVTGKSQTDCDAFQIVGICSPKGLQVQGGTFMMSDAAMEQLQEVLSPQTKDDLKRYTDSITGLPPELRKALSESPVLMM